MTEEILELILHRDATMTEDALRKIYSEDEDIQVLLDSERYSLFAGGKRIRPALTLEFCRMFGGDDAAGGKGSAQHIHRKYQLVQAHAFGAHPVGYKDPEQDAEEAEQQGGCGHHGGVFVKGLFIHSLPPVVWAYRRTTASQVSLSV